MFFLFLITVFTSCFSLKFGYYKDDEKKAKEGVEKFRQYFNDSNFDGLYELTSSIAKKEKNKEVFYEIMKTLRVEFGKIQSMEVTESKVQTISTNSRSVLLSYKTKFENQASIQQFVWISSDKDESGLYEYGLADEESVKRLEGKKK